VPSWQQNVSVPAKQLIASLLNTSPTFRTTAKDALKNARWLQIPGKSLDENDLRSSLKEMKKFNARRQFKGAAHAVLWSVKARFKVSDALAFSKQMKEWNQDDEARERVAKAGTDSSEDDDDDHNNNPLLSSLRPTLAFSDVYEMMETMHTSSVATISKCKHKNRGDIFAVKVVKKNGGIVGADNKSISESVFHELAVLKSIRHPNILEVKDFFEEEDAFYLVMELMDGGDVFDRIISMHRYTEKDARDLLRLLLETVHYIHSKDICHRDLKPQNILLKVSNGSIVCTFRIATCLSDFFFFHFLGAL
jgi:hypothetical protein